MRSLLAIFLFANFHTAAFAQHENKFLLGDWGGLRSNLEAQGVSFESILTTESVSNLDGGVKRGTKVLGNYDLTATVDTERARLWRNGTLFLYFLGNAGGDPSSYIGDSQVTSNIEAYDTFKLYEAWYDHSFLDGTVSTLFGLHDLNSEFAVLEYASDLFNSSFGIQPDISQIGPSIFPTTALALRLRILPSSNTYFQTAIYDGVPGDPNNQRGTHIRLDVNDGVFSVSELGLLSSDQDANYYKLGIGAWYQSTDFTDFAENNREFNGGLYLNGERSLTHEVDSEQGLGVFFQLGMARGDRNQVGSYYGTGISYTGLIPNRHQDKTLLGLAVAINSDQFTSTIPGTKKAESAIELSHRFQVLPFLAIQPDIQYVANPGTDPGLDNSLAFAIRTEISM